MMSWIDSWYWTISTGRHFQNGHHNIGKNQHCSISSQFDMWVDNDRNQFGTSLATHISNCDDIGQCWIFAILWWPFWKWRLLEIFQFLESVQDIIIYPHIKLWCPELITDIEKFLPVAIFKMATTISQKINIVRYHHNLICW
jgi:hypothetical protein